MSGVAFTLSLVDKVTGPAKAMAAGLGSVNKTLVGLGPASEKVDAGLQKVGLSETNSTKIAIAAQNNAVKALQARIKQETTLEQTKLKVNAQMTASELKAATDQAKIDAGLEKTRMQLAEKSASSQAKLTTSTEDSGSAFEAFGGESAVASAGLTAVAAAAVAAVATIAALTVAGAAYALEMTEMRDKTLATFSALSGGEAAGKATLDMLDGMRAKLGMTRAELAPMAQELMAMGYQGAALQTQLTALATVKAVGVDGGTEEYEAILKKLSGQAKVSTKDLTNLYKTGVNVGDVAKSIGVSIAQLQAGLKNGSVSAKDFSAALTGAVTAKGSGALANQANSLTAQWALFKESLGQLFEDVDPGPFLAALKSLLSIFGQGTASGKTMKSAITGAFNGIFDAAAKVLPYIKTGLEVLIIWGLKAYIALKTFFGGAEGATRLKIALGILAIMAIGLLSPILMIVGAVVAASVVFGVFVAAVLAVGAGIVWVGAKIAGFVGSAYDSLMAFGKSGVTIAENFIAGLIGGITGGAASVIKTVEGLGSSMLSGIKGVLGIHSPSIEMAKLGGHTATGFAQGIQAGAGDVGAAAQGLSSAAMGGIAPMTGSPAAASGGGGGNTISINVTVGGGAGGSDAKAQGQVIAEAIVDALESISLTQGLGMAA